MQKRTARTHILERKTQTRQETQRLNVACLYIYTTNCVGGDTIIILVTGASGFIGSNVAHYLYKQGHTVYPLDNEFLGTHKNLPQYLVDRYFMFDITNEKHMKYLLRYKIGAIVHLAAHSSAPMFESDFNRAFQVNVAGFRNVLKLAKMLKCRLLYASTSSLYSGQNNMDRSLDYTEHSHITPNTYYELTKYINEREAAIETEVESTALRFFSVYGYNEMHKGRFANLVSQFLWRMENGMQPTIYGDGTQTRDFVWALDLAKCIGIILNKEITWLPVLNIGTSRSYTINKMVSILNEELHTDIQPKYVENPIKNYVMHTKANIDLLKKRLNYVPETTLREGIKRLIKKKSL